MKNLIVNTLKVQSILMENLFPLKHQLCTENTVKTYEKFENVRLYLKSFGTKFFQNFSHFFF